MLWGPVGPYDTLLCRQEARTLPFLQSGPEGEMWQLKRVRQSPSSSQGRIPSPLRSVTCS